MTRTSKILLAVLVVAVLIIGVGYAAIQNVTLNIDGEATGNPSDANFKVKFTGTPVTDKTVSAASSTAKVTAEIIDDTHATIDVEGLTAKGDTVTATYTVQNVSGDLSADLRVNSSINNDEYFTVEARLGKTSLTEGEATTLVITVELIKTPITQSEEATIGLQLTATPVQPGEEGTSSGGSGGETGGGGSTNYVSASEIFDIDGTNAGGLHIGDFVNYDAGTWTQTEIDAIKTGATSSLVTANGSIDKPSTVYQFGGFTADSSRNGNATPHNTTYNYVKDAATNEAITGWRVFDVEGDTVTLISAGNPEDYYHPSSAYISEYILTGNVNSSWSNGETEAQNYQKRNWDNYVNTTQKAESATVLTKSKLDSWYTKYTNTSNANTYTDATFQKIYQEPYIKYQNMIENYSYYWLSAANSSYDVYGVNPSDRYVDYHYYLVFGVRVLVSLTSNVKFTATASGTKTVTGGNTTSYGGDQTYNVWDIQ